MEEKKIKLQAFPIMMFAITMGIGGLTLIFKRAINIGFNGDIYYLLTGLNSFLFLLLLLCYLIKIIKYFPEVRNEFINPIKINFFPAISISSLLLSLAYGEINEQISYVLFIIGVIIQLFFTFIVIKFWINNNFEINHSNPAWFIPIVGNLVIALAGVNHISNEILFFCFSIGIFFWIILFAIILNRIIFHNQLPESFMPTLFIMIAPPAIGFISYVFIVGKIDYFAYFLYDIGLFFALLVIFMYKNFTKLKFSISWWAFTFPSAAITIATIVMYSLNPIKFYYVLSLIFIISSTILISLVALFTLRHLFKKDLF